MNSRRWWLPSIGLSLWLIFFLALCLSEWRLVLISADGDPCLHRCIGEWMIAHREIIHADQFSHTRFHAPLISKEWLSEVLFAAAERVADWNGAVLLAAVLIATTLWLLFRQMVAAGTDLLLAAGLVLVAALASSMHWLARPHLTTHLLTVVFAWQLRDFEMDRLPARRLWWMLPPLMLLWTNLHGAFFTGFVLIGIYFMGALWPLSKSKALTLGGVLAACLLVSLINPNGWQLHRQVIEFLGTPLADWTSEFRSPNFHTGSPRGFVVLLFLLVLTLLVARPRLRPTEILLIGVWGYFALVSVRNIPIFALVVTPILASYLNTYLATKPWPLYRRLSADVTGLDAVADGRILAGVAVIVMVAVIVAPGVTRKPPLLETNLLTNRFPVAAVNFLRATPDAVPGEMFNEYGWGGYLMVALPERKVFIDGRNDFYGKELVEEFNEADTPTAGWEAVFKKYNVGWTLLPPKHALNAILALRTDWQVAYTDEVAVIYKRVP